MSDRPDLVLVVDTREPVPSPWEAHFTVPTVRQGLPTGDYSLIGCQEWIAIERKALSDLVGCLSLGRKRFEEELRRAQRIRDFYVIVEASYADVLAGRYHSDMNPAAVWESVIAFQQRYGIPFLFAGDVQTAAKLAESILLRWLKEHTKAVEAVTRATKALDKADRQAAPF